MLLSVMLCTNGCAPNVRVQFRYVDSKEPVVDANVKIRPHLAFANPLLPFKTKNAVTSIDGEIELPLDWDADSEAKNIELFIEADGGFHQWSMGKKDRVTRFLVEYWVGEQKNWVEGYTHTNQYRPVEVMIVEK